LFGRCRTDLLATKAMIAWHVAMLLPYVGDLDIRKVHDDTLRPFIDARLAGGVSPITGRLKSRARF
jgi:hypothetical protein